MNLTDEHLHHMAKRNHELSGKLAAIRSRAAQLAEKHLGGAICTLETAAGAWLGGTIEGRTSGATFLKVPLNLLGAGLALVASHTDIAGTKWSSHFANLGNGLLGSYASAVGYSFGKRWAATGSLNPFAGGLHGLSHPYDLPGGPVTGDLGDAHMAAIAAQMQRAAATHG
jgi:hypothetical protein